MRQFQVLYLGVCVGMCSSIIGFYENEKDVDREDDLFLLIWQALTEIDY